MIGRLIGKRLAKKAIKKVGRTAGKKAMTSAQKAALAKAVKASALARRKSTVGLVSKFKGKLAVRKVAKTAARKKTLKAYSKTNKELKFILDDRKAVRSYAKEMLKPIKKSKVSDDLYDIEGQIKKMAQESGAFRPVDIYPMKKLSPKGEQYYSNLYNKIVKLEAKAKVTNPARGPLSYKNSTFQKNLTNIENTLDKQLLRNYKPKASARKVLALEAAALTAVGGAYVATKVAANKKRNS